MNFDVGLTGAFIGGLLSFLSPCVLPLVPPYICFIAGLTLDQVTGEEESPGVGGRVFSSALAFVAGFTVVFVILGASASVLGQLLVEHMRWLSVLAGAAILIMGLHFLGVLKIALFYRQAQVQVDRKPAGLIGAFVIGLAFAFGWTPCVGPVLAAILFVAGAEDTVFDGAILLAVYSLGIGIPFLVAAMFAGPFLKLMRRYSRHLGKVEKTMGALLVVTGILFMTGSMNEIGFWIQQAFPSLGRIG